MRGKLGNEVLNTTVTNTQTLYLFLLHMYSTSTVTTAHLLLPYIARYDFANAILYFAYCKYSEQLASHV